MGESKVMQRRQCLVLGASALAGCTVLHDSDHAGADAPQALPLARGRPRRVAWVLGSGGPRGFVHVGVVKAMAELGLRPDVVVGASVGALVGSLVAAGLPAARIESLALEITAVELAQWAPLGEERLHGGTLARWVRAQVQAQAGTTAMEGLPIALACVATRLDDGASVAFTRGDVGLAVQASAAVQGQFTPVRIRGHRYVDADLYSPLPVRAARALGAARVLAVDASAHEARAPAGAERFRAADQRKRQLTEPDARSADVLLHPDFGYWAGFSREYRGRLIAAGYRDTLAQAPALQRLHAG